MNNHSQSNKVLVKDPRTWSLILLVIVLIVACNDAGIEGYNEFESQTYTKEGFADLGNRVWNDLNGNGIQDSGEPGIADITVKLWVDSTGDGHPDTVIRTTVTDDRWGAGWYRFDSIDPRDAYFVQFISPNNCRFTTQFAGTDTGKDSNADEKTGIAGPIRLEPNEVDLITDAGLVCGDTPPPADPASIGNRVFLDSNANGIQDSGEDGVGDVTVNLWTDDNGDGTPDTQIATTETSDGGWYRFSKLDPRKTYIVQFILPSGFRFTEPFVGSDTGKDSNASPATGLTEPINLDPGENNSITDAGLIKQPDGGCTGRIGDFVFEDANSNGVQDSGDTPIAGARVRLLDASGNSLASTTTDGNGAYSFSGLCAGTYSVDVDESSLPAELRTPTEPNQGGDDSDDSNGPLDGGAASVRLDEDNSVDTSIDFGYIMMAEDLGSIGDTVFQDSNGNGIQDTGEPGIPGVTVNLRDPGDDGVCGTSDDTRLDSDTTDANGNYLFIDLAEDVYCVEVDESTVPDGFDLSTSNNPETVDLDEGQNERDADFGYEPSQALGSIGDTVFRDNDGDGTQDAGEPGIDDVVVNLNDPGSDGICGTSDDTRLDADTTDGNGNYLFSNLAEGDYCVDVDESTVPDGLELSTDNDPESVDLAEGENVRDADFGYEPEEGASLGNFVFNDLDQDGVQDSGEPGVSGVIIMLIDPGSNGVCEDGDSVLDETSTDSAGFYGFDGLEAGDYCVMIRTPDGFIISPQNQGGNDLLDSDINAANGKSDVIRLNAGENDSSLDAGIYELSLICSIDINKSVSPDTVTPGPAPQCDKDNKPRSLTFRYTGGGCAASNNAQGSKSECSGSVGSGSVNVLAGKGKDGEIEDDADKRYSVSDNNVSLGEEFTITPAPGKDKFDSGSGILLSNSGGSEFNEVHTSCSAPLRVGDVYGSLTLVAINGERAPSTEVTYTFEIINAGSPATVSLVDEDLGTISLSDSTFNEGETKIIEVIADVLSTTNSTTTATATLLDDSSLVCSATDTTTVTVEEPVGGTSCEDGKPQELVFEYTGESCSASNNDQEEKFDCSGTPASGTINIRVLEDEDEFIVTPSTVSVGDRISVTSTEDKFKSSFEIDVGGQVMDIHTSCSAPLAVGDQFGSLKLVRFVPQDD